MLDVAFIVAESVLLEEVGRCTIVWIALEMRKVFVRRVVDFESGAILKRFRGRKAE